jgi:uncharacterized protein (DUF952 family)/ubiquinone/menaquinone biosynthesis C-methylase UbiE
VPNLSDQVKVKQSYDTVAEDYAQRIDSELNHKPFDRELLDGFAAQLRGRGPVADLGCGPGMVAQYLHERGVEAFGIDVSPRMVACAKALHPDVPFQSGDFKHLEVADGAWAGIVALYSLVHLPHDQVQPTLREFYRVLRPGGLFLLAFHAGSEVRHATDWWGHPVDLDFVFFETNDMLAYLWGAGFDTEFHAERDPYPEAELQTRRGYILARKPEPLVVNETARTIYRILPANEWHDAQESGAFAGSAHDVRDGFIHFSTADQVAETAAKHYAGQADLVLLHVSLEALAQANPAALKWEASREDVLFPHLYAALPLSAVQRVEPLPLGPDGVHQLPDL